MMSTFSAPEIGWFSLLPMLIVFGAACLGVLAEAFVPRAQRRSAQLVIALASLAAALVAVVVVARDAAVHADGAARGAVVVAGSVAVDGPTLFLWGVLLVLSIAGVLLFAERRLDFGLSAFAGQAAALPGTEAERDASARGVEHTEIYPLLLFSVSGMLLFPAASDLLTLFVALEILSLPLYLLSSLARRRRLLSQEAGLKYFLLGAFASGFFLYGVALVYGYAGTLDYAGIHEAVVNDVSQHTLLLIGMGMLAAGLLFKVGAVPFHAWTPDVYQGAPTPLVAFMSAATKVAAFGALMRLFHVAFGADRWSWQPMMWVVAILTVLVGAVLAVTQSDVKRMLAYSAVAHTGFILTGVLGVRASGDLAPGELTSLQAVLFYVAAYGFVTLGAFAVVSLVRDAGGEATSLERWAGLGRTSPVVAGIFGLFLLAMAGIPLTSGFVGKLSVFTVAASAGAWPVVVVGVAASIVAAWFYIRVIKVMWFDRPVGDGPSVTQPSWMTASVIAVSLAATVALGVLPDPLLDLAGVAGEFIR